MSLKTPDMESCTPKQRCLSGPNKGLAYTPGSECESGYTFNKATCDCESDLYCDGVGVYWQYTYTAHFYCPNLPGCDYGVYETYGNITTGFKEGNYALGTRQVISSGTDCAGAWETITQYFTYTDCDGVEYPDESFVTIGVVAGGSPTIVVTPADGDPLKSADFPVCT